MDQLRLSSGVPLGSGALGQALLVRLRCSSTPSLPTVAKIVSKVQVLQQGKVQSVMNEKEALLRLAPHPFVGRLYGTAQSPDELYFIMEWLPHGDLLQHIRRVSLNRLREYNAQLARRNDSGGATPTPSLTSLPASSTALRCLDFNDIQLITAQLIAGLCHAAEKGVVLRDLKPENVAFDEKFRACLIDFDTADVDGTARRPETNHGVACPLPSSDGNRSERSGVNVTADSGKAATSSEAPMRRLTVSEIQKMREKTASFCGTAQYVSPEMVGEVKWSFSSDLWALGALVYEMLYGTHLFPGLTQFDVLKKVVSGVSTKTIDANGSAEQDDLVDFSEVDLGGNGRNFARLTDFIRRLVVIDPQRRLGVHPETHKFDVEGLRAHPLFDDFDWGIIEEQLQTFAPRIFSPQPPSSDIDPSSAFAQGCVSSSSSSEDLASLQYEDGNSATDALPTPHSPPLEVLKRYAVDPSSSLARHYHVLPENDPSYSEYVFRSTADANPFEHFMCSVGGTGPAPVEKPEKVSTADVLPAECVIAAPIDETEDEEADVIDDVGMRYTGGRADDDFHH